VFAVTAQPEVLEAVLATGRVCFPGCDGPLLPWGFAREREVRMLDSVRLLRSRRACCYACETTHVVVPAWSVPRRRDGADVIGHALLAQAPGDGHRKIALRLGRPPASVRGWLRAFARRAEAVQTSPLLWARAIDAQLEPGRQGPGLAGRVAELARGRERRRKCRAPCSPAAAQRQRGISSTRQPERIGRPPLFDSAAHEREQGFRVWLGLL
jgi:hypothetical protein